MVLAENRNSELNIRSEGEEYLPGDELPEQNRKIDIRIYIESARKPEVYIIHNGERIRMDVIQTESGWKAEEKIRFRKGEWNWARVEAFHPEKGLLFYSNPVWQGKKKLCD